jgi:hypothetical protein
MSYPIPKPKQPEAPPAPPPAPRPKRWPIILRASVLTAGWMLVAGLLVFSGVVAFAWITQKEARSAILLGKTIEAPITRAHSLKTLSAHEAPAAAEPETAPEKPQEKKEPSETPLAEAAQKNPPDDEVAEVDDLPTPLPLPQDAALEGEAALAAIPPNEVPDVPALSVWPRSVALKNAPEVRIVAEDASKDEFIYHTEHFEFSCDAPVGPDAVRHFARVFEATWMLNCQLPLDLRPEPETMRKWFRARILSTDDAYLASGAPPASGGYYSRADKTIYVPISNLGMKVIADKRVQVDRSLEASETLIHEITHQMMSRWLPRLPLWYAEGAAEYVGSADFIHGRFFLSGMEARLKHVLRKRGTAEVGGRLRFFMVSLPELLAITQKDWGAALGGAEAGQNYSSALLLTYFFYHLDGDKKGSSMIQWLREIEKGADAGDALHTHLLRGRSLARLESEVIDAYRKAGIEIIMTKRGGKALEEE